MKRFFKIVSIFLVYCFLVMIAVPYFLDPYNVFHVDNIRDNGVEPNKNYIKMSYILKNQEKFDTFIFGSSRVGAIHTENIDNEKCYNMTYASGVPAENLANIQSLISGGLIPKKIYLGVDSISYTEDPDVHRSQSLRCQYEVSKEAPFEFYSNYLDIKMLKSLKTILTKHGSNYEFEHFYESGAIFEYGRKSDYDWSKAKPTMGDSYRFDETIEEISKIVDICKANNIELVVFTNPMYEMTYKASVEKNYFEFLKRLSEITDFYNFSGLNSITVNSDNYIETSHYKSEIGDMLIECICKGERYDDLYAQGFGMYVTKDNADELITLLSSQIK